jgi:UDP-3-O-[3-hydroxymyristoyl] glucosamine N-acyltransferase
MSNITPIIERREYQPYTYLIKFILTGQQYYGVQHAKGAHPENLWVTYFTSSKIVKKLISEYGKDSFEIVNTIVHATKEVALAYEESFLISVNAGRSDDWLNKHNGGSNFCVTEESSKQAAAKRKATETANPEIRKQRTATRKATYAANPEIIKRAAATLKATWADNPEIRKQQAAAHKATLAANPEIKKRAAEKIKATYSTNPEIIKLQVAARKDTLAANPEIMKQAGKKHKETLAANPEIDKQREAKRKATYTANPELRKQAAIARNVTLAANPDIMKQAGAARKATFSDNPEIMKQVAEKISKWYKIVFPNGDIKIIKNLSQFIREYFDETKIKLDQGTLINVAKGKYNNHKGFKCEYV